MRKIQEFISVTSRQTKASIFWLAPAMMSFIMFCFWVMIRGPASTWDVVSKSLLAACVACMVVSISCKETYAADDRPIPNEDKSKFFALNRMGLLGFGLGFPGVFIASQFMGDTALRVLSVFGLGALTICGWVLMNYANLRYSSIVGKA